MMTEKQIAGMNQPTATEVRNAQPRTREIEGLPGRVMTDSGRILNLGPVNDDPEWKEFFDDFVEGLIGNDSLNGREPK